MESVALLWHGRHADSSPGAATLASVDVGHFYYKHKVLVGWARWTWHAAFRALERMVAAHTESESVHGPRVAAQWRTLRRSAELSCEFEGFARARASRAVLSEPAAARLVNSQLCELAGHALATAAPNGARGEGIAPWPLRT